MRILTLWEPWATLIAIGAKRIETRSWATRYRGPLAIHAARGGLKLWELHGLLNQKPFREAFSRASNADAKTVSGYLRAKINGRTVEFNPGCIVAAVNLVECASVEKCHRLGDLACNWKWQEEQAFGNYEPGRFAWITGNLFRLHHPIPYKAGQGLRILPAEVVAQIKAQGWSEAV